MRLSRIVAWLARALAILGGIVLAAITVLTVASITGRAFVSLGLGPLPGDFELVEAGAGFAVFAFLPWCQLNRGHATVDVFTSFLPARANRFIDLLSEVLMTLVLIVIAWQLYYGMLDKMSYGETTFILQFPVWWPYAACLAAAVVAVVISIHMIFVRLGEVRRGASDAGQGAFH